MPNISYWWNDGLGEVRAFFVTELGKCTQIILGWREISKEAYDIAKAIQDKLENKML